MICDLRQASHRIRACMQLWFFRTLFLSTAFALPHAGFLENEAASFALAFHLRQSFIIRPRQSQVARGDAFSQLVLHMQRLGQFWTVPMANRRVSDPAGVKPASLKSLLSFPAYASRAGLGAYPFFSKYHRSHALAQHSSQWAGSWVFPFLPAHLGWCQWCIYVVTAMSILTLSKMITTFEQVQSVFELHPDKGKHATPQRFSEIMAW